jgi:hypothetical protein
LVLCLWRKPRRSAVLGIIPPFFSMVFIKRLAVLLYVCSKKIPVKGDMGEKATSMCDTFFSTEQEVRQ